MKQTLRTAILTLALAALAAGCSGSDQPQPTGKAGFIAANAIVDAPDAAFLIEERALANVGFGGATSVVRFDDLDYTFNFEISVPGEAAPRRIASRALDVEPDTSYLFVLAGTLVAPEITLLADPERQWEGTETVFEVAFTHVSNELGAVDVYFDAPGVNPVVGNERGTVRKGERIGMAEFAEGDFALILTAAGEPANVLFDSGARTWAGAATNNVLIMDNDPSRTGNVTVRRVTEQGTNSELGDARFPPAARVLHAAIEIGNVDLAENADYDNLIAADLPFSQITDDTALTAGTNTYTFTAAGNPGAPLVEQEYFVSIGLNQTLILAGTASDPQIVPYPGNRRPFATSGRIGIVQTSSAFELVDLYLLEPGQSLEDNAPFFSFIQVNTPVTPAAVEANEYELTLALSFSDTVLAGPIPLQISNREIVEIYVLETNDPNVADIRIVRY